jgi:hypothetical protein
VHWLLLFPFYFFSALACGFMLLVLHRLARRSPDLDRLAALSCAIAVAGVALPLLAGWAEIEDYRVRTILLLALGSFLLAILDAGLRRWLALPVDQELETGEVPRHRKVTAPAVE